jgi:hypothetical protein
MAEEIRAEIANGEDLEAIKDRSGEFIDSWLPVYNNKIVEEWQSMPSEYDDRGRHEISTDGSMGIIALMSLDLYLYYSDLFYEAVEEVENSLELATAEVINEGAN